MNNPNQMHGVDDYVDDPDDNTEEVVNISSFPAKFEVDGMRIKLQPGSRIRIHKNYTRKQKTSANRDPVASPIDNLTGGRVVPASDPRAPKPVMKSPDDHLTS